MFGTRREKNVSSLICNDAVTWSVRGVLQRRMDLPGVGGGITIVLWILFASNPLDCFTTSPVPPLPFPCRGFAPSAFAEANPEGLQVYDTSPRCQPLYYRAGLLRHGSYYLPRPDLWESAYM
jgi:hypothetical protein